jgi:hypothetical protein
MNTATKKPLKLYSLGRMASECCWPVPRLQAALDSCNFTPELYINDVPYFDIETFGHVLKQSREEAK